MRLYLILFTVLTFLLSASSAVCAQSESRTTCPELKVESETVHTSNGGANGEITLKFQEDDAASNYYIFLKCKECPSRNTPEDKPEFKNLKKGYYDIYVIARNGCAKQFNLEVR